MTSYYYDKDTDTMYVFKTITMREFLFLRTKYKHVEVRQDTKKARW